jgi:N-acetylglucosaminyldiphosphoundecaprenol N-acetyl-beta-D-mannosaminyltransferase
MAVPFEKRLLIREYGVFPAEVLIMVMAQQYFHGFTLKDDKSRRFSCQRHNSCFVFALLLKFVLIGLAVMARNNKNPWRIDVLGTLISATSYDDAAAKTGEWTAEKSSRYVCVCPVYNLMLARSNPEYRRALNEADMVTPDGMPVVWFMRLSGARMQTRVYGPTLMLKICSLAERTGLRIFLYGVTDEKLDKIEKNLKKQFPRIVIAGKIAPPFRPPTSEEDDETVRRINESGADILFVAIGTPKQEFWMAAHKSRLHCVQFGVGAAFDFISGSVREAPKFIQNIGMQWAFRLAMEPRRLFKRYAVQNPKFIALSILHMLGITIPPRD